MGATVGLSEAEDVAYGLDAIGIRYPASRTIPGSGACSRTRILRWVNTSLPSGSRTDVSGTTGSGIQGPLLQSSHSNSIRLSASPSLSGARRDQQRIESRGPSTMTQLPALKTLWH